jgi:hydrogenase maturation protein HypF
MPKTPRAPSELLEEMGLLEGELNPAERSSGRVLGYATDGQIWGGEFLIADLTGFERGAHFRYVPLAGGDQAIREPWRMALSYLMDTFAPRARRIRGFVTQAGRCADDDRAWREHSADFVVRPPVRCRRCNSWSQHGSEFRGPGRDPLENLSGPRVEDRYDFAIEMADPWRIDFRPAIREMVAAVERCDPVGLISSRFHNTIAAVIVEACERLRKSEKRTGGA